jgi:hypothetical protein
MKRRHGSGNLGVGGRTDLKLIIKELSMRMYTGFIWLRTGSLGGLL